MKKTVLLLSMIILIVVLMGCSPKQSDKEEAIIKETEVEESTDDEVIEYDKITDEEDEVKTNAEEQEDSVVNIESFEVIQAKVLERLNSVEFSPANYELIQVFEEVDFSQPLHLTYDYEGSPYIYIVEKQGLIKRINTTNNTMRIFMDLTEIVDASENETGLLGMAFHPDFPEDPRLFLYYTAGNSAKIVSHKIRENNIEFGYLVAPETKEDILEFNQPYVNHNGGNIAFGSDGFLYIGSGDGGSKGDPDNNAQNLTNLLGKILRININYQGGNRNYSIPKDNPFTSNNDKMDEIYAYGLRNPWKFSFDKYRELLIAGDVGQDAVEEIDIIENGGNYGWSGLEGTRPYNRSVQLVSEPIAPIYEYTHDEGESITGGITYYGKALPSLYGVYVYGDFISGNIWGLWIDQDNQVHNELLLSTALKISSFGIDANQELYIVDFSGGIYQLEEQD